MNISKLVFKNTFFLFLRMIVVLLVGLLTTKYLLNILGFNDYGLLILAGSIVALASFFIGTLNSISTRFISISLIDSNSDLAETFERVLTLHYILIMLVALVMGGGYFFIDNFVNVKDVDKEAFKYIYIFSTFLFLIDILKNPFNSLLISKEKMNIYAMIEVLFSIIKLCCVFIAAKFNERPVVVYSVFVWIASIFVFVFICVYCRREILKFKIKWYVDKKSLDIIRMSSWDFYGSFCSLLRFQGITILINNFFNIMVVTSIGIGNQIQNIAMMFVSNINTAIKPQIFKKYSEGDYESFVGLIYFSIKITLLLLLLIIIPFFIEGDFILFIWLGDYPDNVFEICKIILIFILFSSVSLNLVVGLHALGKIKKPSLINGTLYLLIPIISYFAYLKGSDIYFSYYLNVLFIVFGGFLNGYYLKKELKREFSLKRCYIENVFPVLIFGCVLYLFLVFISNAIAQGFIRLILIVFLNFLILSIYSYVYLLDNTMRVALKRKVGILWKIR